MSEYKNILITGAAGFIGSHLTKKLLQTKSTLRLVGVDNLNDYYDVSLKKYRLQEIEKCVAEKKNSSWHFIQGNVADKVLMEELFRSYRFDAVIHLAAQAGVRYSITNPDVYIDSNIIGFFTVLEACRHYPVRHLLYASSSSVYGANQKIPYSTDDKVDRPVSLYAATKKSNELFAYAYSKLYQIPTTGLRFFTVYGPAGRPDMAYFKFTDQLIRHQKISLYNYGQCQRDFTYIDDVVEAVSRILHKPHLNQNDENGLPIPPYKIYNIGNNHPETLLTFTHILQEELTLSGILPHGYDFSSCQELVPPQPGDVPITFADISPLSRDFNFAPSTSLRQGLHAFVTWYKSFYSL